MRAYRQSYRRADRDTNLLIQPVIGAVKLTRQLMAFDLARQIVVGLRKITRRSWQRARRVGIEQGPMPGQQIRLTYGE